MVLLDLKINDMSAGALVATMRQWSREPAPVVLMSCKASNDDRRAYRAAGARGVIAKPFDPVGLPDRILEMIVPAAAAPGMAAGAR